MLSFFLDTAEATLPNTANDNRLTIERRGGFGGFGLPGSHIKSGGELLLDKLSAVDRKIIDALFAVVAAKAAAAKAAVPNPDGFIYRLTRTINGVAQTIEVAEDRVPEAVRNAVKDTLA